MFNKLLDTAEKKIIKQENDHQKNKQIEAQSWKNN